MTQQSDAFDGQRRCLVLGGSWRLVDLQWLLQGFARKCRKTVCTRFHFDALFAPAAGPQRVRDGEGRIPDPEPVFPGERGEVFRVHRAAGRKTTLQNQVHRGEMGGPLMRRPARYSTHFWS